jgi:undecaprenyl diphosphate synthase
MNLVQPSPKSTPPLLHVAVIMDGNGRWAKQRNMSRTAGHRHGVEAVRRTVRAAATLGIDYLTLYSFSSENWKRPPAEIDDLMGLLRLYLRAEIAELHKNDVRLRVIGNRSRLARDIVTLIDHAEEQTASNTGLTLVLALSYGSREEIVAAAREVAGQVARGELAEDAIDETVFASHLSTVGIPDPDLIIRTSGEQRLSNFLLWQSAYTELLFVDRLWPDFSQADLEQAVAEFRQRDRRYGATLG